VATALAALAAQTEIGPPSALSDAFFLLFPLRGVNGDNLDLRCVVCHTSATK
jgi:hypothetical protein